MTVKELFNYKTLTLSNLLSMSRVFLVPVVWYTAARIQYDDKYRYLTVAIVLLMILTDFLDGFIARWLKQETPLGQYLDPVADKIVILSGMYLMCRYVDFPVWLAIAIVLREIAGVWLGGYLLIKKNILGKPNQWGKWGVTVFSIAGLFYLMNWPFKEYLPPLVLFVFIAGMFAYSKTYWKTVFGSKSKSS